MERGFIVKVKTGVKGLDELLGGGIPERNLVLVSGECGVGKTTLSLQYLVFGGNNNEPGVFVTLEEDPARLRDYEYFFEGWNISKLEEEKKLIITRPEVVKWKEIYPYKQVFKKIINDVEGIGAKRVVLDSITTLGYYLRDPFELRRAIFAFSEELKSRGVTTLIISEIPEGSNKLSFFGVEEFITDGVIVLTFTKIGERFIRTIHVRKMRFTEHSTKICPMKISKNGIEIFPTQPVYI